MADPTPDYAENVPRRRFEREDRPVDWIAAVAGDAVAEGVTHRVGVRASTLP